MNLMHGPESPEDETFEQDLRLALKRDAYSSPMPDRAKLVEHASSSPIRWRGWHLAAVAGTAAAAVVVVVAGLGLSGRLPGWEVAAPGASPSSATRASPTQPTPDATPTLDRSGLTQAMWIIYNATGTDVLIGVETSCTGGVAGADVSETQTTVDIKAWVAPSTSGLCFPARGFDPVVVPLDAPLGDRELTGCLLRNSKAYDPRTECSQSYDDGTAVSPSPDRDGQIQSGWIVESVSGDNVVIRVDVGCVGLNSIDVTESDATVDIRAWVGRPSPSAICLEARVYYTVTVSLDQPLGERMLTGCLVGSQPDDLRTDCRDPIDDGASGPPRSSPSEGHAPTETFAQVGRPPEGEVAGNRLRGE